MSSPSPVQDLLSRDVPLQLFGGLNTELAPSDVPEGVSPDNADVAFVPGSVSSRPALKRLFTAAISGNVTLASIDTYVMPNGEALTLVLDSSGKLWKEDVFTAPGVLTLISQVTPGSYARFQEANGRVYIAFSDGLHGNESPRQYDGTNFDRVSQDGPGASSGMSVSSVVEAPQSLASAGAGSPKTITTITPSDPVTVGGA